MKSIMSQNPCITCTEDRQNGNPYYWQTPCHNCEKKRVWDMEKSARVETIEQVLGDNYDLDSLRELVKADQDGRCVVLPNDGMVYYVEEAGNERWIANKPIQQITVKCGWGLASLEFSLFDKGKYFSREEAEAALKGEQNG